MSLSLTHELMPQYRSSLNLHDRRQAPEFVCDMILLTEILIRTVSRLAAAAPTVNSACPRCRL